MPLPARQKFGQCPLQQPRESGSQRRALAPGTSIKPLSWPQCVTLRCHCFPPPAITANVGKRPGLYGHGSSPKFRYALNGVTHSVPGVCPLDLFIELPAMATVIPRHALNILSHLLDHPTQLQSLVPPRRDRCRAMLDTE